METIFLLLLFTASVLGVTIIIERGISLQRDRVMPQGLVRGVEKSSVTELGNFIAYSQKNGYSTLGGQVVNPYNAASEVGGSSTGSAVCSST